MSDELRNSKNAKVPKTYHLPVYDDIQFYLLCPVCDQMCLVTKDAVENGYPYIERLIFPFLKEHEHKPKPRTE